MRTQPYEFDRVGVGQSVDQDEVRPDMAVAMVRPLVDQRMIVEFRVERLVGGKQADDAEQGLVQVTAMPPPGFPACSPS
jgi:hypothetical protein